MLIHLSIGFSVAFVFTGSVAVAVAGGIALVEPMANAVAFFIHEKVWKKALRAEPRLAFSRAEG